MVVHNYSEWAHHMWEDNCAEREAFDQPLYTKDEYLTKFESFLRDEYCKSKNIERDGTIGKRYKWDYEE